MGKSKAELEAEISQAIIRFEKEWIGRGPVETRTYLIDDLVLVRLKRVLTAAELKLAEAKDAAEGRALIKQLRQKLIEQGRPLLEAVVRDILQVEMLSLHTDISSKTGERIIVFTLDRAGLFLTFGGSQSVRQGRPEIMEPGSLDRPRIADYYFRRRVGLAHNRP